VNAEAIAAAYQADGKIVVVGDDHRTDTGAWEPLVARFNANGSLDTTFGGGTGYLHPALGDGIDLNAVAIQPDQRIVLGGGASGGFLAARLNADGTLDTTFGGVGYKIAPLPTGYAVGSASDGNKIALMADGVIIVAGQATEAAPPTGRTIGHPSLVLFYGDNPPAGTSVSST